MSDFAEVFGEWLIETVQVEPSTGGGWDREQFGASHELGECMVQEVTSLQRDGQGNLVEGSGSITRADDPGDNLNVGDRVTLPSGRVGRVISLGQVKPVEMFGQWVAQVA